MKLIEVNSTQIRINITTTTSLYKVRMILYEPD